MLALDMASGVTDLSKQDNYTWVLSRTEPSGVRGSITNDDEESMVREELVQAAVFEWKEGEAGCSTKAEYKAALTAHLQNHLDFIPSGKFWDTYTIES